MRTHLPAPKSLRTILMFPTYLHVLQSCGGCHLLHLHGPLPALRRHLPLSRYSHPQNVLHIFQMGS